jgi:hypothetical protein
MKPARAPPVDDRAARAGFRVGQLLQGLIMGPLLLASLAALFASQFATFSYQGF